MGCVGRHNGRSAAEQDLQDVCDVGNDTDTSLAFGDQNPVGVGWELLDNAGTAAFLAYDGVNQYLLTAATAGLYPNVTMARRLGGGARLWQRTYSGHHVGGVAIVGDASFNADDETFIDIDTPAAGTNTITLPTAAAGWWYIVNIDIVGVNGLIALDDAAGDAINGGAGPVVIWNPAMAGHKTWFVWAQDATNWVAKPMTDLGF